MINPTEPATLGYALRIMRKHNAKGTPVLRLTSNQFYERELLQVVLDGCDKLLEENAKLRAILRSAVSDLEAVGTKPAEADSLEIIDPRTNHWRYRDLADPLIKEGE